MGKESAETVTLSLEDVKRALDRSLKLTIIEMLGNFAEEHFESFEVDRVGADLAYLMAAIANDTKVQWSLQESALLRALRGNEGWQGSPQLWEYILITEPDQGGEAGKPYPPPSPSQEETDRAVKARSLVNSFRYGLYRHWRGGLYVAGQLALSADDENTWHVVYTSADDEVFTRDIIAFLEEVKTDRGLQPRFRYIGDIRFAEREYNVEVTLTPKRGAADMAEGDYSEPLYHKFSVWAFSPEEAKEAALNLLRETVPISNPGAFDYKVEIQEPASGDCSGKDQ